MSRLVLLTISLFTAFGLMAQVDRHRIEVTVEGYDHPILTLANNVLDKQYIVDTATVEADGTFVFASDTAALPPGIYLIVTAPDNNYFQVLITEDDQEFSLTTSIDDLNKVKVKSHADNKLFYEYLDVLAENNRLVGPLREQLVDSTLTTAERDELQGRVDKIDKRVRDYQDGLVAKNPTTLTAAIIKVNAAAPPPEYTEIENEDDRREAQFRWLQRHYFDSVDLQDGRLLRTPFLVERINYFVDRLHVQRPDSIAAAIDKVLKRMEPQSELFKYYVVHFTNRAAQSNVIGMDAVYVHMVDNYYATGRAYWAEEDQLAKMKDNAERIRPLLIGEPAPDLKMKSRDGEDISLYGVDAKYTILYFWAFDCGHCKKSTPHMKAFYEKWKDRGVEIFSICTKQKELESCWEYIDEKDIGDWMHATDRYMRFFNKYDVRSTPSIFVLDREKVIISKKLGAAQLDGLLTDLEELEALENSGK